MTNLLGKFLTCLMISQLSATEGNIPGVNIKIHPRGLEKLTKDIFVYIESKFFSTSLQEIFGNGYRVRNIKLDPITFGKIDIENMDDLYTLIGNKISIVVKADWKVWKEVKAFSSRYMLKYEGKLSGSVSNAGILQQVSIKQTRQGEPIFGIEECRTNIGKVDVQVHNTGRDWIIQTVRRNAEKSLLNLLRGTVCPVITQALKDRSEQYSKSLNVNFPLYDDISVELGLLASPLMTSSGVDIELKGRCYPQRYRNIRFPFSSRATPLLKPSERMISLSVSGYVLNSLLHVLHKNDYFQTTFAPDQIMALLKLNDTLTVNGLQHHFRASLNGYENSPIYIHLRSSTSPFAQITPEAVEISANVSTEFSIRNEKDGSSKLATFTTSVNMTALYTVHLNEIVGVISSLNVSSLGQWIDRINNDLYPTFLKNKVQLALNNAVKAGFMFPEFYGYKLHSPQLALRKNSIELETDLT